MDLAKIAVFLKRHPSYWGKSILVIRKQSTEVFRIFSVSAFELDANSEWLWLCIVEYDDDSGLTFEGLRVLLADKKNSKLKIGVRLCANKEHDSLAGRKPLCCEVFGFAMINKDFYVLSASPSDSFPDGGRPCLPDTFLGRTQHWAFKIRIALCVLFEFVNLLVCEFVWFAGGKINPAFYLVVVLYLGLAYVRAVKLVGALRDRPRSKQLTPQSAAWVATSLLLGYGGLVYSTFTIISLGEIVSFLWKAAISGAVLVPLYLLSIPVALGTYARFVGPPLVPFFLRLRTPRPTPPPLGD